MSGAIVVSRRNNIGGDIAVAGIFSNTIGAIPWINLLLGDGLFGVTYRMTGPVDDPDVNVNPLSVIAPGFLRKVFGATGVTEETGPNADTPQSQRGN